MTNLSDWTASRPGWKAEPHQRFVALARLLLAWERAWPALWPATGILGVYFALALFDAFAPLPAALRSLLFLAVLSAAGFALYREFRGWRTPAWEDGARRVERDSALQHRPITERTDRMGAGHGDPLAESLWRAHLAQRLRRLARLRLALPSPGLGAKDPRALRWLVLMFVIASIFAAGSDWQRRLALATSFEEGTGAPLASLDAWVTPPAYTGWAPIYLRPGGNASVAVPAGSELVMRAHGGRSAPRLELIPSPEGAAPAFAGQSGNYGAEARITADTSVTVRDSGGQLGHWNIRAIADQPPVIAFAAPPGRTERDALKLSYTAGDDYGVVGARAVIRPVSRRARGSLSVDLPLPEPSAKTVSETAYRDLTANPLAGLDVEITLEAKDGAGQIGRSAPMRMRLPERIFTNPLARALIEQRQVLAADEPGAREHVADVLDALSIAPERFYANQSSLFLGLRTAFWTLTKARGAADIAAVQDLLWQMATALEQGGLSDAAQQLRELQQLLSQALAQGAPQSTIDALLQRYEQALSQYLRALAQNGARGQSPPPKDAKVITPKDIEDMLKAIQQLTQTGARGKAQELLAMLQNLLENMRPGTPGTGSGGQEDKALGEAMKGLGDIIGRQRQLLDKSMREGEGAGDPRDGGGKGLAGQQGKLREDLDRIGKALGGRKVPGADKFGEAGRDMGDAQDALGSELFDRAGGSQKDALDALKDGASQLAQEMMKQNGESGEQSGEDQDPLGRSQGARGGAGSDVKLPDPSTMKRARAILEELRRRASEPGRPKQELDYIDRLLRDF